MVKKGGFEGHKPRQTGDEATGFPAVSGQSTKADGMRNQEIRCGQMGHNP